MPVGSASSPSHISKVRRGQKRLPASVSPLSAQVPVRNERAYWHRRRNQLRLRTGRFWAAAILIAKGIQGRSTDFADEEIVCCIHNPSLTSSHVRSGWPAWAG